MRWNKSTGHAVRRHLGQFVSVSSLFRSRFIQGGWHLKCCELWIMHDARGHVHSKTWTSWNTSSRTVFPPCLLLPTGRFCSWRRVSPKKKKKIAFLLKFVEGLPGLMCNRVDTCGIALFDVSQRILKPITMCFFTAKLIVALRAVSLMSVVRLDKSLGPNTLLTFVRSCWGAIVPLKRLCFTSSR